MSTVPFAWFATAGTGWHSLHATASRSVPATRCFWWAPTPRAVVSELPFVSIGGAGWIAATARVASPWQVVHTRPIASLTPLRCFARLTVVEVYPGWHVP